MSGALDWLADRAIAHRGLHAAVHGILENSASAALAAVAQNFAIECDIQITSDGEAVVFHDFTLDRLTELRGRIDAVPAHIVTATHLGATHDRISTLADFCSMVAGSVPLVCEIKSRFDGDMRLAERAASVAAHYGGPICFESFDPRVMAHLRKHRAQLGLAHVALGMVAQAHYDGHDDEWGHLSEDEKRGLAQFLHWDETRPEFLSYSVRDLPHAVPFLCRTALGIPVTAWTVRSDDDAERAKLWADQIVFEGAGGYAATDHLT